MEKTKYTKKLAFKVLLTNGERQSINKIPPIEPPRLKTKPQECPFGNDWNFIWHRFLQVL